jgi:hypothetical protein
VSEEVAKTSEFDGARTRKSLRKSATEEDKCTGKKVMECVQEKGRCDNLRKIDEG